MAQSKESKERDDNIKIDDQSPGRAGEANENKMQRQKPEGEGTTLGQHAEQEDKAPDGSKMNSTSSVVKKEGESLRTKLIEKTYQIKTEGRGLAYAASNKSLHRKQIQRVRPPNQIMIETGKNLQNIDINGGPVNYGQFSFNPDGNVEYKLYLVRAPGKFSVPYLQNVVRKHYEHISPEKTQRITNVKSVIPEDKRAILEKYRAADLKEKADKLQALALARGEGLTKDDKQRATRFLQENSIEFLANASGRINTNIMLSPQNSRPTLQQMV